MLWKMVIAYAILHLFSMNRFDDQIQWYKTFFIYFVLYDVIYFFHLIKFDEKSFYLICFVLHNKLYFFHLMIEFDEISFYLIFFLSNDLICFFIWWSNLLKYLFIRFPSHYMIRCIFFIWWSNLMKYLFISFFQREINQHFSQGDITLLSYQYHLIFQLRKR